MINAAWMRQNDSDKTDAQLAALFDRDMTALDVLTRKDGAWATVGNADRIWIITRPGVLTSTELRAWAARLEKRYDFPSPYGSDAPAYCAFANGCGNIAYTRAKAGEGLAASLREGQRQLDDAIFVLAGAGTRDVKPMDEGRYD